jgi:hypothetical protein
MSPGAKTRCRLTISSGANSIGMGRNRLVLDIFGVFMKRVYLITVIAIIVTTSIATHLLAVSAFGPATPVTGLPSFAREWRDWLRHYVDRRIEAKLARRKRRETIVALCYLDDRMLRDIGLHRDGSVRR